MLWYCLACSFVFPVNWQLDLDLDRIHVLLLWRPVGSAGGCVLPEEEVQSQAQWQEACCGGEEGLPGARAHQGQDHRLPVQGAGGAAPRDRPERVAGQQQCAGAWGGVPFPPPRSSSKPLLKEDPRSCAQQPPALWGESGRGQAELTQPSSCTCCWKQGGPGGSALGFFTSGSFSSLPATTFFHHINLQYSTISEFCTGETCQTMAVCNTQYYWYDERGKKVKCTAPQYVDFVMSSVQKLVTDEDVFPTKYGREFPSSFESLVRKICRHLFHVLAHIYWAHFKETLALELHGHLNTLYVHFILFAREFNLLDPKETAIMDDLTEVLCSGAGGVHSGGSGDGAGSGGPGAQNHVKER
uniref:MOB kinase activator 2 n=1 Tax=Papio anubis TaxID=9555 RepID=A0A8I5R2W8_PAPAN